MHSRIASHEGEEQHEQKRDGGRERRKNILENHETEGQSHGNKQERKNTIPDVFEYFFHNNVQVFVRTSPFRGY